MSEIKLNSIEDAVKDFKEGSSSLLLMTKTAKTKATSSLPQRR